MATTSPDNLRTPNPGDPYNLVPDLATFAQDVQNALIARGNVSKGTAAQRASFLSTAIDGMLWQDTDGIKMIWRKDGANWVPAIWRWAGTTAQMNAFTQAPAGFEWFNTSESITYLRLGGAWAPEGGGLLVQVGAVQKAISATFSPISWSTGSPQVAVGTGMADAGQPTRLTAPRKGIYAVSYNVRQNGTTASSSRLLKNGSVIPDTAGPLDAGSVGALGAAVTLGATGVMDLNLGDYLTLEVSSASATAGTYWLANSVFSLRLIKAV